MHGYRGAVEVARRAAIRNRLDPCHSNMYHLPMNNSDHNSVPRSDTDKISVCIIAGNEEDNIRRCLESVTWADEVIVVDSYSKDNTPEICKEYTDRVYQHEWLGYIKQKQLIKELAQYPWVMFVDADEEVSPELRDEIQQTFAKGVPDEVAGFEFPRLVFYLNRWIRHGDWYPDVKLRLFRRERGKCGGSEPHDRIFVDGHVTRLRANLRHYTYRDIEDQLLTINRFSSISANEHHKSGRRFFIHDLLFRPTFRFFRGYIIKRGFLDGIPGLLIGVLTAYGTFIKYAKMWELRRTETAEKIDVKEK